MGRVVRAKTENIEKTLAENEKFFFVILYVLCYDDKTCYPKKTFDFLQASVALLID